MTETQLQRAVIELSGLLGYLRAHFRPALTGRGWRTPVEGDGAGFPDLVLAGHDRVIFAELKSATGRLSDGQVFWLAVLGGSGVETYVWRPKDWVDGTIERILRANARPAA